MHSPPEARKVATQAPALGTHLWCQHGEKEGHTPRAPPPAQCHAPVSLSRACLTAWPVPDPGRQPLPRRGNFSSHQVMQGRARKRLSEGHPTHNQQGSRRLDGTPWPCCLQASFSLDPKRGTASLGKRLRLRPDALSATTPPAPAAERSDSCPLPFPTGVRPLPVTAAASSALRGFPLPGCTIIQRRGAGRGEEPAN